jgi:hypothetical protein
MLQPAKLAILTTLWSMDPVPQTFHSHAVLTQPTNLSLSTTSAVTVPHHALLAHSQPQIASPVLQATNSSVQLALTSFRHQIAPPDTITKLSLTSPRLVFLAHWVALPALMLHTVLLVLLAVTN